MADFCDREGAAKLGARIEAYWAARGRSVRISYVDGPFTPQMRSWRVDIRSDMVDGSPYKPPADAPKRVAPAPYKANAIKTRIRRGD